MPLHLCRNELVRRGRRARRGVGRHAFAVLLLGVFALNGVHAQDHTQTSADMTINFRRRPNVVADTQRLRRTPQIDGVIAEGEWDPFYTVLNGPIKGTVYCNWDDEYLYIAARTDQAATLVIDIDAADDGWLRGADNLELVVGSPGESGTPTLAARLLDAATNKDMPIWSPQSIDLKSIQIAEKTFNGMQTVELAIPQSMGSLVLQAGISIGLRVDFLPPAPASTYTPTVPYEPHLLLDANLVEARAQAASGINPTLTLSGKKFTAGERLFATLTLSNLTGATIPIRSLLWSGVGPSANVLNTQREVTVPSILANRTLKRGYKTYLSSTIPTGNYTLSVTAELADGRQVQATSSFNVVEPIRPSITSDPTPLIINGPTKMDVIVSVYSALPDHFTGNLEVTKSPSGWELEGKNSFKVTVTGRNNTSQFHLPFTLPGSTQPGDYPVNVRISWNSRVWDLEYRVHVQSNVGNPTTGSRG